MQWNRMKNPITNLCTYKNFIYKIGSKEKQWGKDGLFPMNWEVKWEKHFLILEKIIYIWLHFLKIKHKNINHKINDQENY